MRTMLRMQKGRPQTGRGEQGIVGGLPLHSLCLVTAGGIRVERQQAMTQKLGEFSNCLCNEASKHMHIIYMLRWSCTTLALTACAVSCRASNSCTRRFLSLRNSRTSCAEETPTSDMRQSSLLLPLVNVGSRSDFRWQCDVQRAVPMTI